MSSSSENQHPAGTASFGSFLGIEVPLHFGDPRAEARAVATGCGAFDARYRTLIHVTGDDRVSFLQGMLTNDVAKLAPGHWLDAAHLTIQGKIISTLRVYADPDCLWLDVPAQRATALREALDKYIVADDVELLDSDDRPLILLEGAASTEVVRTLSERLPESGQHIQVSFESFAIRIVAVSETRATGYLLCGPIAAAEALWRSVKGAGAVPAGMLALDALRIDAGVPWYDCDMDEGCLAPEAGLVSSISFKKGCYLGQEIVERVTARGQLQKKLVGISGAGRSVPDRGTRIEHGGEDVGWITSAAWSEQRQRIVALGYVRRSAWGTGTEIQIPGNDAALAIDDRVPSLAKDPAPGSSN